ncbi:MAG: polysaccharide deacetylase, partial [Flavobacteriales bacterium CG_4_10_14_0_8_um_filter_32_5]
MKKNNLPLRKNCFHLTFDDGLSEFYHVVAPILLEKKIPATVFLNSNFIDNKALFFRYKASILADELTADNVLDFSYHQENELDELAKIFDIRWEDYLTTHQPYLTSVQIQELINQGFTF